MLWYQDLTDYFGVDEKTCIALGRPFKYDTDNKIFPSKSANQISREEISKFWIDENRWKDKKDIIENYKKIGSWLAFRQVYKNEAESGTSFRDLFFEHIKPSSRILEYGCGVAPLSFHVVMNYRPNKDINFSLCDVKSEHYEFGQYRLKKHLPEGHFNFYYSTEDRVIPQMDGPFDVVCIMDVLEHLIDPYGVMLSLYDKMSKGSVLVETWVDCPASGCNLKSSSEARAKTIKFIQDHYKQTKFGDVRKWIKF